MFNKPLKRKTQKVITVTLNPSLDRTLVTNFLHIGYQNYTIESTRLDAAGDGLNISQALDKLSINTHALVLLGNDATGKAFQMLINDNIFPLQTIRVDGRTRSNTIILDTGSGQETQITEEASDITYEDVEILVDSLKKIVSKRDLVVLAGSLPSSLSEDTYSRLSYIVKGQGAEVMVSTTGEPLRLALETKPDLVTLTQPELEAFFNIPIRDQQDVITFTGKIHALGARQVLIDMDNSNQVLVYSEGEKWIAGIKNSDEGTTSGAWHALLAGYIAGQYQHQSVLNSLKLGISSEMFTASQIGNRFGSPAEFINNFDNIKVNQISE